MEAGTRGWAFSEEFFVSRGTMFPERAVSKRYQKLRRIAKQNYQNAANLVRMMRVFKKKK